jgi:hypothetical protein
MRGKIIDYRLLPDEAAAKELLIDYCREKEISFLELIISYRQKNPELTLGQSLVNIVQDLF